MFFASFTGPDLSQFRLMVHASVLKDAAETLLLSGATFKCNCNCKRKLLLYSKLITNNGHHKTRMSAQIGWTKIYTFHPRVQSKHIFYPSPWPAARV